MRKIATLAACMFIIAACAQKKQKTAADNEQPTTITWIEDKPGEIGRASCRERV